MKTSHGITRWTGAAGVCLAFAMSGVAHSQPIAVVELFTSQGCSSCPPADKIIGDLARDSRVIALSMPIDYWDYLGWKDTLAIPASARGRNPTRTCAATATSIRRRSSSTAHGR